MKRTLSKFDRGAGTTLALLAFASVLGCHTRKDTAPGSLDKPGQPASVNPSWANAAKSCWPELAKEGASIGSITQYLATPANLRATFPAYGALSDADAQNEVSMPLTTIFPPDPTKLVNAQTPVLTRGQAVNGTPLSEAAAQHTTTLQTVPPDALCSIQSGLPPGFHQ